MTAPRSHEHRAAATSGAAPQLLQRLFRARAQVSPRLQRRYRAGLAGGLALTLVAGVSAAAVVDGDAATARADLSALGLEAEHLTSPGVTVPGTAEMTLGELEVDAELGKSDVVHLPEAAANQEAERRAIAEREAAAAEREAAAAAAASRSATRQAPSSTASAPQTQNQPQAEAEAQPAEQEPTTAVSAGQGGERGAIASMVNSYRADNGQRTLGRDGTLDQVAQGWAEWMASNQTLQHNPSYRSQMGSGWSAAGENIVRNTGGASMSSSAITSWMVGWWKNSAPHRANMLNSKYTHVGVGYSMGSGGPYAVLLFGGR